MGNGKVLAGCLTWLLRPSSSAEETVSCRLQNTQQVAVDINYLDLQIMQMTFKYETWKASSELARTGGI